MNIATTHNNTTPVIGGGIFLAKDVSKILNLPYSKVRHWLFELWDKRFADNWNYSFGEDGNKAIDFHTLIEFYIFYQLRESGVSSQQIQKVHKELAKDFDTKYPFAHAKFRTDGKGVWYEKFGVLVKANGKKQIDLKQIIQPFLTNIEFGKNNIAERYFPLTKSKSVVIDPKHQFGQPTISGTNIKTQSIFSLYKGGESKSTISDLYNISLKKVSDAIEFHKNAA
jgi:uncharacterized protein (DUF433 family)